MRFSLCPAAPTIREFAAAAAAAERAGYARVWASELHRDPFVQLAAAAGATSEIGLATGIALAFVRSPLTTALAALDLDELSHGRFTLGLGTGVARLNEDWHNARFGQPVPHLRETVALVRQFVAGADLGEPISFEGEYERASVRGFRRPYPPARRDVPVYLAAVGPALTTLAGRIADGWIAHELCSPHYLATVALPRLAACARPAAPASSSRSSPRPAAWSTTIRARPSGSRPAWSPSTPASGPMSRSSPGTGSPPRRRPSGRASGAVTPPA